MNWVYGKWINYDQIYGWQMNQMDGGWVHDLHNWIMHRCMDLTDVSGKYKWVDSGYTNQMAEKLMHGLDK